MADDNQDSKSSGGGKGLMIVLIALVVILILAVVGDKEHREEIIRDLKRIADNYQIKLDIPRLRQMEEPSFNRGGSCMKFLTSWSSD
mgnify:CR=1 FL=1